ncbi:WD40-repeat-containing domain protein [Amylocystis lapponica]|nr:WD40-repeat-containing domain protein [Amylocystis lapponica]
MSLVESSSFRNITTPIRTTSLPSEAYVLSIASSPAHYAAATSSPNNAIHLFDKSRLQSVFTLSGHENAITNLRSVSNLAGMLQVLVSCGRDGLVKVWDERTQSAGLQMSALRSGGRRALLACDVSSDGSLVAAGTDLQADDASILYWDPRNPVAPLRVHSSTHSDDITALHFSRSPSSMPKSGNILLSASSDGLVCTSSADEADEDEAGLHVGNAGCSLAQAGWIHRRTGSPGIWASSDMETLTIWSSELDLIRDNEIRQPSIHRQDLTWVTDYVIGCHSNSSLSADADNDLSIFVGSNEGDLALLSRSTFSASDTPWTLSQTWTTGHVGVVRSFLWDEQNNVLLTGGEDSKLNIWSGPPSPASASASNEAGPIKRENDDYAMDVDGDESPMRKKRRS